MFGALRRNGVVHALRASTPRCLSTRSIPQRTQWHHPSLSVTLSKARLYHSSPVRFSEPALAQDQQQAQEQPNKTKPAAEESAAEEPLTQFSQLAMLGLVDPRIIRTITNRNNITTMTEVQQKTIKECLDGHDVLAQARTGTGKTIAFLLPMMEKILRDRTIEWNATSRWRASDPSIRGIVISPTRELAEQIATEARQLASGTGIRVQTAVGGNSKIRDLRQLQHEGCHLLVGTPGRLKDVLSDSRSGVDAPNLSFLVLDEADRLLDDGFAPEIKEIQKHLPHPSKVDRQTLMFSATVPKEVMTMVRKTTKPDFKFIKTVKDDEVPTHMKVPQKAVILNGYENMFPAIFELAKNYAATWENTKMPFKAMIYFNSTKEVRAAFEVFIELLTQRPSVLRAHGVNARICEIHSRLTQQQRTKAARFFRESRSAIMFSSDVTARGMDFPGVTHVLQVGIPRDRDTYIHRVGRTGRANNSGEAWIFVHEGEAPAMKQKLKKLPIEIDTSLGLANVDMSGPISEKDAFEADALHAVKNAMHKIPEHLKNEAYLTQMITARANFTKMKDLTTAMNNLAMYGYGLSEPPMISWNVAKRLSLSNVPELNVVDRPQRDSRSPLRIGNKPHRQYWLPRNRESEPEPEESYRKYFPRQSRNSQRRNGNDWR
ncbi:hypothetical protein FE257_010548 [Aspergillus nanangensis]|uniref:ATP-dependent RNA helicase n=1 Tax=Aspergillus nanangensis TaxID=2582783 RepID=A0AAD4GR50_ASPNN|nr:hypothetical protein FE257_010548 [Aspergillus nanangensis]